MRTLLVTLLLLALPALASAASEECAGAEMDAVVEAADVAVAGVSRIAPEVRVEAALGCGGCKSKCGKAKCGTGCKSKCDRGCKSKCGRGCKSKCDTGCKSKCGTGCKDKCGKPRCAKRDCKRCKPKCGGSSKCGKCC